jgi:exodeoxyribonuclease V beta subunit
MMKRFNAADTPLAGTNLIEASAGTGKTFTISMIYLRLLVENKLRIDQILVVTFTVPATMELRLRIRNVLMDALRYCETGIVKEKIIAEIMDKHKDDPSVSQRLRGALKSFDEASVYTIHSFCQQVLADNAFESGSLFSSDIAADDAIHERLAADFWRMNVYNLPEFLAEFIISKESPESLVSLYKRRPLSPQMRIEPVVEAPEVRDIEKFLLKVEKLHNKLSAQWKKEHGAAEDFILNSGCLSGNIYRKKKIPERLENLALYLDGDDFLSLPDGFEYFTNEKIKSSLNKGREAPDLTVFKTAGLLAEAVDEYYSACSDYLVKFRIDMFSYIDTEGRRIKGELGKRGFDDLIRDVQIALRSERGILLSQSVRGRYKAALIDEFQDTDDLQYDIFNGIFGTGESILFLIGDPKQAIYRFRGADIFSYIKASKTVKNRYTLADNYRSTPELIRSVNSIFSSGSSPFVFKDITFTGVEAGKQDQCDYLYHGGTCLPAMNIGLADYFAVKSGGESNDDILLSSIASEISDLTLSGRYKFAPSGKEVKPSDIAVLVRSHHQASAVQEALAQCGIPSVTRGHESVLSTPEAGEICRVIAAVAEPGRSAVLRSAAGTSIIGYSAADIFRFNDDSHDGVRLLEELTERFNSYRDAWLKSGFMDMFTLLLLNENITVGFLVRGRGSGLANINTCRVSTLFSRKQLFPDELVYG